MTRAIKSGFVTKKRMRGHKAVLHVRDDYLVGYKYSLVIVSGLSS